MKLWPTAETTANLKIFSRITGLATQKANPEISSPYKIAITVAVTVMNRFVQTIKSYGLGFTPSSDDLFLSLFCNPPVIPSHASERTMNTKPRMEEELPDFFFPIDTMLVPRMMAPTCCCLPTVLFLITIFLY